MNRSLVLVLAVLFLPIFSPGGVLAAPVPTGCYLLDETDGVLWGKIEEAQITFAGTGKTVTSAFSVDVCTDHLAAENLYMQLISPTGTVLELKGLGRTGPSPFTGNFPNTITPYQSLDALLGEPLDGTWTLIYTTTFNEGSTLFSWAINGCPAVPPSPTGTPDWSAETSGTTDQLNGVFALAGPEAFACGASGRIQYFDGASWLQMPLAITDDLYGIWAGSNTDVFAVGENGVVQHYNGSWNAMASNTTEDLKAVFGSSATDVFAVGAGGQIQRYNGTAWSAMASGTAQDLNGVWAAAADDVFAVGAGGVIMHYDGSAWSAMAGFTTKTLYAVWGSSGGDVYAVGEEGAIGHWDGTSWTEQASGVTTAAFGGVFGADGKVFAVGQRGWILQFDGASWAAMVSGTENDLLGAWGTPGASNSSVTIFAVGLDGTILSLTLINPPPPCFIRSLQR